MHSDIGDICIVTLVMGESGGGGVAPCGAAHTQPVPAASRPARRHCIALMSPLLSSLLQLLTAINTIQWNLPIFSPQNFGFVPTRGAISIWRKICVLFPQNLLLTMMMMMIYK